VRFSLIDLCVDGWMCVDGLDVCGWMDRFVCGYMYVFISWMGMTPHPFTHINYTTTPKTTTQRLLHHPGAAGLPAGPHGAALPRPLQGRPAVSSVYMSMHDAIDRPVYGHA
jgi:hypothetical protein